RQVMHEHVPLAVGVAGDQVGGEGLEGDLGAVAIDRRALEPAAAVVVPLVAGAVDAGSGNGLGGGVHDEDVAGVVGVAWHQVGPRCFECDPAPVVVYVGISLGTLPAVAERQLTRGVGPEIAEEDLPLGRARAGCHGVAWSDEGDVAAVAADIAVFTVADGLSPEAGDPLDADTRRGARLHVVDEDVIVAAPTVLRRQGVARGHEHDEAAIITDRRLRAGSITLRTSR